MKKQIPCDMCGKLLLRYPSQLKRHNFCSRKCLADFSSRERNPEKYSELKEYKNISSHMSALNAELNPKRMTEDTRKKISVSKRKTGSCKGYPKYMGKHCHRIEAEKKLGRPLFPGEVVHHIDGDKTNYTPENLMVFRNQAEHAKWHAEHKGGDAI